MFPLLVCFCLIIEFQNNFVEFALCDFLYNLKSLRCAPTQLWKLRHSIPTTECLMSSFKINEHTQQCRARILLFYADVFIKIYFHEFGVSASLQTTSRYFLFSTIYLFQHKKCWLGMNKNDIPSKDARFVRNSFWAKDFKMSSWNCQKSPFYYMLSTVIFITMSFSIFNL